MQLAAAKNTATTEDEYLAVIRAKTAALFSAAAEVGPVISGRERAERAAFRSYGTNLGLAFQLIDDALDYGGSSAELGKRVGDDFREGKITLPVVLSYRRGSDGDRALLAAGAGRRRDRRRRSRTRDRAHAAATGRSTTPSSGRGISAPSPATHWRRSPNREHKSALIEAVDFCIERAY